MLSTSERESGGEKKAEDEEESEINARARIYYARGECTFGIINLRLHTDSQIKNNSMKKFRTLFRR